MLYTEAMQKKNFSLGAALAFVVFLAFTALAPGLALAQSTYNNGLYDTGYYTCSTYGTFARGSGGSTSCTCTYGGDYPNCAADPCPAGDSILYGQCVSFDASGATIPTASLSLSGTQVLLGSPLTVTWSSANADSCDLTFKNGSDLCANGFNTCKTSNTLTWDTTNIGSHALTLTCTGGGSSASQTVAYDVASLAASSTPAATGVKSQLDALFTELQLLEQEIAALTAAATTTPLATCPVTLVECAAGYVEQSATSTDANGCLLRSVCVPTSGTAPGASCSFNGQTIGDGQLTTAYQSSSVAYGSQCVSEQRTCINGTLSGDTSYSYPACTTASASGNSN